MLDATGHFRTRYSDVLRAVGHHLDTLRMRAITVIELDEGFLLKGHTLHAGPRSTQIVPTAVLFTNADLEALIDQAYARRGSGSAFDELAAAAGDSRYQDVLRAIGFHCDQHDWHDVVLVQTRTQYLVKGASGPQMVDTLLDKGAISRLLDESRGTRRTQKRRWFSGN